MRVLAFVGCLTGIWLFSPIGGIGQERPQPTAPAQAQQQIILDTSGISIAIEKAIKTYADEKAAGAEADERKDRREQADLIAQQDQVYWAKWMTYISSGQLAFSIATAILLFFTYRATKATERRQLRAYVGIEKIDLEIRSAKKGYAPITDITGNVIFKDFVAVTVKNFGVSPAKSVQVIAGIAWTEMFQRLPNEAELDKAIHKRSNPASFKVLAYLNTKQEQTIKCPLTDVSATWLAREKQKSVYVVGRIYYEDAYGEFWSVKFCYAWEPWHPGGERFVPYEIFNGEDKQRSPDA